MLYFFSFVLLYWISSYNLIFGLVDIRSIYSDLEALNNSCDFDKCSDRKKDSLETSDCHCDVYCTQFDTCCLESQYFHIARPKLKPTCSEVHHSSKYYFMVDRCPTSSNVWESECRDDMSYDSEEDVLKFKIVPVTSLFTSVTYKNYFCFKCHETNNEFVFWNVNLQTTFYEGSVDREELVSDFEEKRYSLINDDGKWIASFRNNSARFHMKILFEIPEAVKSLVKRCIPDVIMNCSAEWTDNEMREKCHAYMSIKEVQRDNRTFRYKNIHCALCNFEYLDYIKCRARYSYGHGVAEGGKFTFTLLVDVNQSDGDIVGKVQFSFAVLLDFNRSDGEKVGKIRGRKKCGDGNVWDPYMKKCRKLVCALPGYKVQNGKCVRQ